MTGAGSLLRLIRNGEAVTRADLVRRTGLARSTVAQRLDALLAHQLVYEAGGSASTGGRPPTVLAFNQGAGVVLVADLGATHSRLVVSDLAGAPLAETTFDMDIADGPESVLEHVHEHFAELLERDLAHGRRRPRRRRRRPGPGGLLARRARRAADHARLGRLLDPGLVRQALRRAGARRQRREHHGAGRALDPLARDRAPAVREDRHRHRLRHRRGPPDPPRRPGRGGRHRPRASGRPRRRHLPLRQHRLPRGRRGRARSGVEPYAPRADGRVVARRRGAGARRRAAGDPGRARRGALPRRGPRRVRELLQPGCDRHRRRHLRGSPAAVGGRA